MSVSNAREQRRENAYRLIREIRQAGPLTRYELARRLDLAAPSVSNIMEALDGYRIVKDSLVRGRNNHTVRAYEFDGSHYRVLGFEFRRAEIYRVVCDIAGHIHDEQKYSLSNVPWDELIERVLIDAKDQITELMSSNTPVLAAGFGLPGALDETHDHLILATGTESWGRGLVRSEMAKRLGIPVVFDKNPTMAAYAEYRSAPEVDHDGLIYVAMNQGIGTGVIFPGGVFHAGRHFPTEIGHTSVERDGPVCECGNRGCLEIYASLRAIVEVLGPGPEVDPDRARPIVDRIAMAIGNACSLTGIRYVVLGGLTVERYPSLVTMLQQAIPTRSFPNFSPIVTVVKAKHSLRAASCGAAFIASEHILRNLEHYLGTSDRSEPVTSIFGVV